MEHPHTQHPIPNNLRVRCAVNVANWILRTFAPDYEPFIAGAIEYGLRAAAQNVREGTPPPPDWRLG